MRGRMSQLERCNPCSRLEVHCSVLMRSPTSMTLSVYIVWRTPATQIQLFPCTSIAHPSPSARDSRRGLDRRTIAKSPSTREMGRRCFRVTNITLECILWSSHILHSFHCHTMYSHTCPSCAVQLQLQCSMFCITALLYLDKCYTANTDNNL